MENFVHSVFVEDAEIAISEQVHLESLEFDAFLARHVLDSDGAVVGQSGFWTDGGVLGKASGDDVTGELIGPGIELWQFGLDAGAGVLRCVVSHIDPYCTIAEKRPPLAEPWHIHYPLQNGPPEAFDELPSMSNRLPAFEAAIHGRLFFERSGCSSMALPCL